MIPLTDETLMAYADEALSAEERRAVGLALAANPEARRTVSMFAMTRDLVRQAFSEPMWWLSPHALVGRILASCQVTTVPCERTRRRASAVGPAVALVTGVLTLAVLAVLLASPSAKSHPSAPPPRSWSASHSAAFERQPPANDAAALDIRLDLSTR